MCFCCYFFAWTITFLSYEGARSKSCISWLAFLRSYIIICLPSQRTGIAIPNSRHDVMLSDDIIGSTNSHETNVSARVKRIHFDTHTVAFIRIGIHLTWTTVLRLSDWVCLITSLWVRDACEVSGMAPGTMFTVNLQPAHEKVCSSFCLSSPKQSPFF